MAKENRNRSAGAPFLLLSSCFKWESGSCSCSSHILNIKDQKYYRDMALKSLNNHINANNHHITSKLVTWEKQTLVYLSHLTIYKGMNSKEEECYAYDSYKIFLQE